MKLIKIIILIIISFFAWNSIFAQQNGSVFILKYNKKHTNAVIPKASSPAVPEELNSFLSTKVFEATGTPDDDDDLKTMWGNLTELKQALKEADNDDTARLRKINDLIKGTKLSNTYNLLSPFRAIRRFSIFDIGMYNIDTLNSYLYNQNGFDFLQTASIQSIDNSNKYINAEFGTYLFGPLKLGFGGSFRTKSDTSKDNAIKTSLQKIVSNGGALNFNFSLPLVFIRSKNENVHFGIFGQINNGFNPEISDSTGKTQFSSDNILYTNQTGLILHFDASSDNQLAKLSFELPFYYVWGSTNTYNELSVSDFSILKFQFGFVVKNYVNLHIAGPLWSSSKIIQQSPFSLSLGFSPSQIIKSTK